jgi:hypothetical protein
VLLELVSVVFCSRESKTWRNDTFDPGDSLVVRSFPGGITNVRRVIGQVQEKCCTLHRTVFFKVLGEESASFQVDTHGTKDNGEVVVVLVVDALVALLYQTSLSTNLSGDFVVGKTSGGEDGNFLTTSDGIHRVDGGDTCGDHFLGVHLHECVSGCAST